MSTLDEVRTTGGGPAGEQPVLEVTDLRVRFRQRGAVVRAVNGVSYRVAAGQTLAIIGESGSGKTVSARAVMGLLPGNAEVEGSVRLNGVELVGLPEKEMRRHRGTELATVFQDPTRSLNPTMRIGEQIGEAIQLHEKLGKNEVRDRAIELLRLVRVPVPEQRYYEYPHQMSGGMRQRIMMAIALSGRPKLLFADEATTSLDVTTQAKIMELLEDLQEQFNMAVVMISHNLALAASYADDVMVMYGGKVVEHADTKTLFSAMRMPYTQVLLEATPHLDGEAHSLLPASAAGSPPDLRSVITGCSFAPRCPQAEDKCHVLTPPLEDDGSGHEFACWFPLSLEEVAHR